MKLETSDTAVGTEVNLPGPARRPDIQGLRAVAVLLVVAFHAGLPVPGGFIGVDIFFVISGFVITAMLHREWRQTGRIRFGHFYLRRFKRLTPALALVVAVTITISFFVLPPFGAQQNAAKTGIGSMLLVANFVIARTTGGYFDAPAETNPLLNTWSLSVEEQFYLVFPALIALGWILARRKGLLRFSPPALVLGVGIVSFALAWKGAEILDVLARQGFAWLSPEIFIGFYSPFTRAWEFAAGAFLALALAKWTIQAPRLLNGSGLVGAAMLAASLWLITDTTPFPGAWTLLPVAGTLLLLWAGTHSAAPTSQILSTRPMAKVGDWSYSIYLWHWPFIVFTLILWPETTGAVVVLVAFLSFVPAVASYRWLEQPIRSLQLRSRPQTIRLVTAVLLPPMLISAATLFAADRLLAPAFKSGATVNPGDVGQPEFHDFVDASYHPCTPEEIRRHALYWDGFLRCQQSLPDDPVDVVLVGDSHAEHLFLGLAEEAPDVNVGYYILDELPIRTASDDMARILDHVANDPDIHTVILTAAWTQRGVPEPELTDTLEEIHGAGKTVFITDDVPSFPLDPIRCRNRATLIGNATRCQIDAQKPNEIHSEISTGLGRIVDEIPGVELLETHKYFCGAEECSMTDGSRLLYRDSNHLNLNGTRFLGNKLIQDNENLRESMKR